MENIAKEKEVLIRLDNPRVWRTYLGGRMIDALHGNPDGEDGHFPEEWIMSVVAARNVGREDVADEGLSHIYGTQTALKELIEATPAEYLGAGHAAGEKCDLGVLVKIIDSSERLTIQAHPDIPTARALFSSPHGKNGMLAHPRRARNKRRKAVHLPRLQARRHARALERALRQAGPRRHARLSRTL